MFQWLFKRRDDDPALTAFRQSSDAVEPARKYFFEHAPKHLRSEHWQLVSKDPVRHLANGIRAPHPDDWPGIVGDTVAYGTFVEILFHVTGIEHPELLVRLLVPLNRLNSPIHESLWYPEGDLEIDAKRSVVIRHQSRLPVGEVRPYFTEWPRMANWMAGGCRIESVGPDVSWFGVGQDHDFELSRIETTANTIVFDQVWIGKYHCRVTVDLRENAHGTIITVTFFGIISIHLEEEYEEDWCLTGIP